MGSTDRAWRHFGEADPYYGVLTQDRFRGADLDDQARRAFFASGAEYLDHVTSAIARCLDRDFHPRRALDFGCGVGRVALPLARVCDEVVGVDVSPGMLTQAAENAEREGVANLRLVREGGTRLSPKLGSFDFIHSFIVFQHIRTRRGLKLIESMLGLLEPDGVGSIHVTYADGSALPAATRLKILAYERMPGAHAVRNLVERRPLRTPRMHMGRYNLNRVARLLQENGCHSVHLSFTEGFRHGHPLYGVIMMFRKHPVDTTRFS